MGAGPPAGRNERGQLSAPGVEDGEGLGGSARARPPGVARRRYERSLDKRRAAARTRAARGPLPRAVVRAHLEPLDHGREGTLFAHTPRIAALKRRTPGIPPRPPISSVGFPDGCRFPM